MQELTVEDLQKQRSILNATPQFQSPNKKGGDGALISNNQYYVDGGFFIKGNEVAQSPLKEFVEDEYF